MYISRQTYEGDHHTVTPYKEFPTNILLENITCLLSEQSSSELESLKKTGINAPSHKQPRRSSH